MCFYLKHHCVWSCENISSKSPGYWTETLTISYPNGHAELISVQRFSRSSSFKKRSQSVSQKSLTRVFFLGNKKMYKTKLQEICHEKLWSLPSYTTSREGPDHNPKFRASVVVNGTTFDSPDFNKSAKEAQNEAAKTAVNHLITTSSPVNQSRVPLQSLPPWPPSSSSSSPSPGTDFVACWNCYLFIQMICYRCPVMIRNIHIHFMTSFNTGIYMDISCWGLRNLTLYR